MKPETRQILTMVVAGVILGFVAGMVGIDPIGMGVDIVGGIVESGIGIVQNALEGLIESITGAAKGFLEGLTLGVVP